MGTTQRIIPGVSGQPNWGDLNRSITSIAKTIEKERELDIEEEEDADKSDNESSEESIDISKRSKKLEQKKKSHVQSAIKRLIQTAGGRKAISSGKSRSVGRAGLKSVGKLSVFISRSGSIGLDKALQEVGFNKKLVGKNIQQIIDFLIVYCSDASTGMDDVAANMASCEILKSIAEEANNDYEEFKKVLSGYSDPEKMSELLCNFFGYYIFEHLSQRFQEKITQLKGETVSREAFQVIKDDILGQIRNLDLDQPIANINWSGNDGKKIIESIFDSIIAIFA